MRFFSKHSLSIFGYTILAFGLLSGVADVIEVVRFSYPFEQAIVLIDGAFVVIGLVVIAVAQNIEKLEQRITQVENAAYNADRK
jgi:hypothetical protein